MNISGRENNKGTFPSKIWTLLKIVGIKNFKKNWLRKLLETTFCLKRFILLCVPFWLSISWELLLNLIFTRVIYIFCSSFIFQGNKIYSINWSVKFMKLLCLIIISDYLWILVYFNSFWVREIINKPPVFKEYFELDLLGELVNWVWHK